MNVVTHIADQHDRDYITPEDITEALQVHPVETVRRDVLAVIGQQISYGIEDVELCAFVAFRGKTDGS